MKLRLDNLLDDDNVAILSTPTLTNVNNKCFAMGYKILTEAENEFKEFGSFESYQLLIELIVVTGNEEVTIMTAANHSTINLMEVKLPDGTYHVILKTTVASLDQQFDSATPHYLELSDVNVINCDCELKTILKAVNFTC